MGSLFGLAPREVFLAPSLAFRAVGSYPAVSPLPETFARLLGGLRFLWHCLSGQAFARPACGHAGVHPTESGCFRFPQPRALRSSDFPLAIIDHQRRPTLPRPF